MSTYDYNSNANRQINKYDDAIESLKKSKENLEISIDKLETIKGIESCNNLKTLIKLKIEEIEKKITDIKRDKYNIRTRVKYLEQQELQNMENNNEI